MNSTGNRNYRNAFSVALFLNLVLLAVIGVWWWRSQKPGAEQALRRRELNPASPKHPQRPLQSQRRR